MFDHLFWLTEKQFARLKPLLPNKVRGVPRVDDRRVISGIVHVLKSGCRWIDAPQEYGPRKTLCNRFVRWAEKGVWRDIFLALVRLGATHHALPPPVLDHAFMVLSDYPSTGTDCAFNPARSMGR